MGCTTSARSLRAMWRVTAGWASPPTRLCVRKRRGRGESGARPGSHFRRRAAPPPLTPPRKGEGRLVSHGGRLPRPAARRHPRQEPRPWISASPKNSRCCATRVASYLADHYDFESAARRSRQEPGWRPEVWKAFAEELGILGAAFSEELGGLGGGPIENMVVMEEFGKALVVEPYLGTVVIGGGFLKHSRPCRGGRPDRRDHRRARRSSPSPTPSPRAATTWPT